MNYSNLAFTEEIKKLQTLNGSREAYEQVEIKGNVDGLTDVEIEFISEMDGFYLSTIGENGFPYIQFRGGPKGFLKVLNSDTIGFPDFKGNMQYISIGNLKTKNKVALFLMDYSHKRRLRIYAETDVFNIKNDPELSEKFDIGNYKAKPERAVVFKVIAFEWACPKFITPKFTEDEIQEMMAPQLAYIKKLEKENKELKEKL